MFMRLPEVPMTPDQAKLNRFWAAVPADVAASLDDATRSAISDAILSFEPKGKGADLRFSNRWFYVRIMAGRERRGGERRTWDKKFFPLLTRENIAALVVLWSLGIIAAYGVMSTAYSILVAALN